MPLHFNSTNITEVLTTKMASYRHMLEHVRIRWHYNRSWY